MPPKSSSAAPSPAVLAGYNAVPSVLWSALALGPLAVFCYQHLPRPWLWGLLGVSLLAYGVPKRWFGRWQLSPAPARYRRLGVARLNQFTQHGGLVNGLLRRRYPHYRRVPTRAALRGLVAASYQQERFHLGGLLFMAGVSLYALSQGRYGWALLLTLLNVGYNLYPVWLQQYLRLRVGAAGAAGAGSRKP